MQATPPAQLQKNKWPNKVAFNKHKESQEVPQSLEWAGLRLRALPDAGECVCEYICLFHLP